MLLLLNLLYSQQTETQFLSGTGADNTVDWEFYCSAGNQSGYWTLIPVPSCWEQQGFGSYNYGLDSFEDRLNETGRYRYTFIVPQEWKNKEIQIVFNGVMTDAEVKINGKLAGAVHQGAFYQFKYDITKLLNIGSKNQLEVFVKKHSDNESVSLAERKSDFWIFGGIFRPVYLEAKPKINIQRVAIDARHDGKFKADVFLSNTKDAAQIRVTIKTLDGVTKHSFDTKITEKVTRVEEFFENPITWNPEFPNLYQAVFSILDKKGQPLHQYAVRFGFRTVDVREADGIYVNGVRIKMKGVCRHTFHPQYGRTSSKALSLEAVNLIKDMNMNAVRMSHYPPDKHFLDVCDSLGLFVLDELSSWQKPAIGDTAGRKVLEEMIAHDVNHPSIILWDNGNEGGENNNLNDYFTELDIQKRKVLHPWQDYDLTNTLHYNKYNYLSLDGFSQRKIFFPTELLHGLYDGGGGAGLDEYWQKMWAEPLAAGGFLWVFADEAIKRTDKNNKLDSDGNHAPDGILGPYNEKEGSYYTVKEIWSPVYFEKRYITPEFDGMFRIENRYHYTNLNRCSIKVEWVNFSCPGEDAKETIEKTENLDIDLEPGQNGFLRVSLDKNWQDSDALRITATDAYGRELNTWSWPVKSSQAKAAELLGNLVGNKPKLKETGNMLKIYSNDFVFMFNKQNGTVENIIHNNRSIPLSNGPLFVSKETNVEKVTHYYHGDSLIIEAMLEGNDNFKWTIYGNGLVDLYVQYEPADNCQYAGVTFDFPEKNIAAKKWLGNGPYRVYKNRMKGTKFGLWENNYNNTITGYSAFIYPEFKGYFAQTYWVQIKEKDNPGFTVYVHSHDIFLGVLTPDEPDDPRKTKMTYPAGDISFLQGINAIGTKFTDAHHFGPQSNPYYFSSRKIHRGKLHLNLTFDFSE